MESIHITTCTCERKFLEAIGDLRNKGARNPRLIGRYAAAANELQKVRRSHFSDCTVCRREDAATNAEAVA